LCSSPPLSSCAANSQTLFLFLFLYLYLSSLHSLVPVEINFCLRCGARMERRETYGAVRPVCPACGFIHFIDPKVAVGVLVEQAGKVLLIRRANPPEQGRWSFPAGFVDGGEDPARAAEREVLEETGLTVHTQAVLDVVARAAPNEGADILIVYRAEVVSGALAPGDDAADARYFGPEEIPDDLAFPSTRKIVAEWRAGRAAA
jgi:ADP-ribose pyrophosphatase YjhB (NUDIX family)